MKWLSDLVIPPWLAPLILVVLLAVFGWKAYDYGVTSEHDKNKNLVNKELVKKQEKILELTTMNRELERQHTADTAASHNLYQEQNQHAQAEVNSIIHDVRTGAKRLYVNTNTPVRVPSDGSPASPIAAIRLDSDATTRSELSKEDGEFLVTFAADADQVTRQLELCQRQLLIDRNLPVPDLEQAAPEASTLSDQKD